MWDNEFDALMAQVAEETGFVCYETQAGSQITFFGTSDKLAAFKTLVGDVLPTGTIAYTMDNGESCMYSHYKEAWY